MGHKWWTALGVMLLLAGTCSCQGQTSPAPTGGPPGASSPPTATRSAGPMAAQAPADGGAVVADASPAPARSLVVQSPAFREGSLIPRRHTCDGEDVSPALSWSQVPASTRSVAIICDDPDAPGGTWVHWVAWNLPPRETRLPEHVPPQPVTSTGLHQGLNDFQKTGYNGPCPPGGTHRYYFRVYALDATLDLPATTTSSQLRQAMQGHVVAEGALMGRYSR